MNTQAQTLTTHLETRLPLVPLSEQVPLPEKRNWGLVRLLDVSIPGLPSTPPGPRMSCLT